MNSSPVNQYDAIERIIFETGIRITKLESDIDADKLSVILSSGKVLYFKLSAYRSLRETEQARLINYEFIADGPGAHWPELDDDLSFKGFLEEELKLAIGGTTKYAMAA